MNFNENEIVTLDIAIRKVEDGVFAAGASFQYRHVEGGSYRYEPFKVASLYIDNQDVTSTNKCILHALEQLSSEIPDDTKLVRIRSDMPHFHRGMKLKKILEPTFNKKVVIRIVPMLSRKHEEISLLINDAILRKESVVSDI
ncbi:hypothetical protein CON65_09480 [Bacillus pseudomycoides]|uniref:Uncharacterized protein n=1 Tax=Bacillus pseudomycoides TaxID=64104 RepID=A0AA91VCS2_9BACI|nr:MULTISPECIES: hypothetical protein [Bacillus]PEB48013.1 hypothetical protein COO03_24810 [Bacillus sp. AFS098217]PED82891.1 hypothetical protein CON65_09480 [Bacillus pseudomycoides]PEU09728.1 hypothetical protein CN524_18005 [Bacillus sp. AFS019443]PEU18423.1 hypothetical protein CN525_11805 [Bacillus sp. AFS014408]PFW62667.1 hypothetical protein COL20_12155 [Bacillus sp. AFS075034]